MRVNLAGYGRRNERFVPQFRYWASLSVVLLYLILVAQFKSFKDPMLIMLAIPMGFIGVLIVLAAHWNDAECHVADGCVDAGGYLGVEQHPDCRVRSPSGRTGKAVKDAVITSCRVRLRPILMTSLATIIGMVPMALKLGTGSEQYAPLARAIIGGLTVSVVLTVFIVPAAYLLVYGKQEHDGTSIQPQEAQ